MDGQDILPLRVALISAALALGCVPPAAAQVLEYRASGGDLHLRSQPDHAGWSEGDRASACFPKICGRPRFDPTAAGSCRRGQRPVATPAGSDRLCRIEVPPQRNFAKRRDWHDAIDALNHGLGVDPHVLRAENARGGAAYLRQMLAMFDNNVELAVAAYNAGPNAVLRHKGIPPYAETRTYVAAVMDYLARTSVPETK